MPTVLNDLVVKLCPVLNKNGFRFQEVSVLLRDEHVFIGPDFVKSETNRLEALSSQELYTKQDSQKAVQ